MKQNKINLKKTLFIYQWMQSDQEVVSKVKNTKPWDLLKSRSVLGYVFFPRLDLFRQTVNSNLFSLSKVQYRIYEIKVTLKDKRL